MEGGGKGRERSWLTTSPLQGWEYTNGPEVRVKGNKLVVHGEKDSKGEEVVSTQANTPPHTHLTSIQWENMPTNA